MAAVKGEVVERGQIIVSAAFRKSMGLSKGDTVFIEPHGYELRVRPARLALRRIQDSRAPSHQMAATCRQAGHGASGEGGSCVGEGTF
jgi:bifunctional DNA-binding transcriptional regulator/antitoxin component of YhaV-PrlF toxin-antitoxin module